jgi:mono/diheme cytochrome c family protein
MRTLFAILVSLTLFGTASAADRTARTNYVLRCIGCHTADGTGLPNAGIPDFVGKIGAFAHTADGRAYLLHVPGVIGSSLSAAETADVLNYIMDTWGGASLPRDYTRFTADEVTELKARSIGNVVKFRHKVAADLAADGIAVADYPWP